MKRYGLIGYPLSHSFSEKFFAEKFRREGITDSEYVNFPLEHIEQLPGLIKSQPQLRGLNVTIPYKEKVIQFLDQKNDVVNAIDACNCIRIEDGQLAGFNTDVAGFEISFSEKWKPHHTHALVLGEGGAAKAVSYVLEKLGIDFINVVRKGSSSDKRILYSDLAPDIIASHTVIINCTPVGMYPAVHECPPLDYEQLTPDHYLYDLIYNPEKTLFLKKGEGKGAMIKNGLEMLVIQAEESWRIWNRG